jgi:dissimilatory sulfite reductase (desulfoviridin) alpha/beta subunit
MDTCLAVRLDRKTYVAHTAWRDGRWKTVLDGVGELPGIDTSSIGELGERVREIIVECTGHDPDVIQVLVCTTPADVRAWVDDSNVAQRTNDRTAAADTRWPPPGWTMPAPARLRPLHLAAS